MSENDSMVMRIYRSDYDIVEAYRAKRGLRKWIEALHELIELGSQSL